MVGPTTVNWKICIGLNIYAIIWSTSWTQFQMILATSKHIQVCYKLYFSYLYLSIICSSTFNEHIYFNNLINSICSNYFGLICIFHSLVAHRQFWVVERIHVSKIEQMEKMSYGFFNLSQNVNELCTERGSFIL